MPERHSNKLTRYELQRQQQNRYFEKSLRALTVEVISGILSACSLYAMLENIAPEPITKGIAVVSGIVSTGAGAVGLHYSSKSH